MRRTFFYSLAALVLGLFLSACGNTLHGIGADMERAGEQLQDTFD